MTIFLLILMALLLVAALERTNRRQSARPPGLNGSHDREDRDWARTQLELLALGDQPGDASPTGHASHASHANPNRLRLPSARWTAKAARSDQGITGIKSD